MIMSNSSQAQGPPTSSTTLPRGERQISNAELWHACAGPLVSLPAVGSHVIYFPQGHSEQVAASTQREVVGHIPSYRDLPPELVCRLDALILQADEDTDEVYCQMTLQPVTLQVNGCVTVPDVGLQNKHPNIFFCKTLTASDTSTHGGFSVPRRAAEEVFPPLDYSLQPPTQEIVARDLHDREWKFRHVFRGQPKRHLLTTGWSVFVSSKRLVAGDAVLFIRNKKGQLLLGIRRANRPQTVMPSSVLSSDTMHIGVLAAAAHAASTRSQFTVFYNPRTSPSEFVIPLSKYEKAMYHVRASMGMRFGMLFESEESRVRRYMGTITAISDLDPVRWPNSSWRSIKVIWDESSLGTWRRRICLWEIEPLPTFLSCPPSSSWRWNCPWPQLLDFSLSSGMQLESSTNLAMVQNENAGLNCMAVQAMGLDTLAGNFPRQLDTASGSDLQNTLGAASWPAIFGLKQLHFQQPPMWAGQMLYNVQTQPQQRSPNPTFQQQQPEEPHLKIQPHPLAPPAIQQRETVKTHFPSCEELLSPHIATQQKQTLPIQQLKGEGSTLQQQTQGESVFQQPNALQQQLQMPIKQQAKQSSALEEGRQHGPIPQQLAHQQPVKESGSVHHHIKHVSTLQQQTKQKAFTPPPKHSSSPLQHQHASTLTEKITHEPPFQQQLKQSTSFQHGSTLRQESLSQPPIKLLKQSNGLSYPQYPEVFLEPHSNVLQRYTGAFSESHSTVLQQQQTHAEKPSERHFSLLPDPSCGSESCVINIQPQAPPSSITSTPQLMPSKPIGTLNSMAGPCDRTRLVNPLAALDDSLSTPSVHANIEMDNAHATMMLGPELYHLSFVGEESLFSPSSQPASAAQSEVTSASGPVKTPFASLEMHSGLQASVPASAALSSTLLNTRDSWQEHDDLHSECHQQTSFGVTTTYNMYPDEFQSQCLNHLIEGESSSIPLTSQSFYGSMDNKNSLAPSSQATAPIRTYTKVYKSGSVGRSLDVARFNGYNALRRELARMFGLEGQLETSQSGWQLIFVDKENDWLLLGDDPWEVFIHNVRSIRILSPVEVLQMQDGIVGLPSTFPVYPQQTSGNSQDVIIQQDSHDLSCVITPTCMLP